MHLSLLIISGPVDEGKCPRAGSTGNIVDFCQRALKISGQTPIVQEIGIKLPPTPGGGHTLGNYYSTFGGDKTIEDVHFPLDKKIHLRNRIKNTT